MKANCKINFRLQRNNFICVKKLKLLSKIDLNGIVKIDFNGLKLP